VSQCVPRCQLVGPRDDVRLRQVESQLTKIATENQALKSQHQDLERRLDEVQQKNTRLCSVYYRVPTNLENLELSGNFVNLEKSGKSQGICDMVREFF